VSAIYRFFDFSQIDLYSRSGCFSGENKSVAEVSHTRIEVVFQEDNPEEKNAGAGSSK
jgi:hypothetical protein